MNENYSLVIGNETSKLDFGEFELCEPVFMLQDNKHLRIKEVNHNILDYLIQSVSKNPKDLLVHLQRINLCYEQNNEDHLYAALADFFVVLQSAGLSIKQRVLAGSKNHLSPLLLQRLQVYITDYQLIPSTPYTVLTSGLESDTELVLSLPDNHQTLEHDPIQIARDYIEYSQLDEAREMLESAILVSPDYAELHTDLLELYKSTNNIDAFHKMKLALSEIKHPMHAQWDALNSYFTQ